MENSISKNYFFIILSYILTITMVFPIVFSLSQHETLTIVEFESKTSSEINDTIDFLEGIIEHDYASTLKSDSFKNQEYQQFLTSDDYKVVFFPPPEITINFLSV